MAEILQLPVFTVDGWSGNTLDGEDVEWWVTSEKGWSSSPPLRLELANRPQRDGTFDAPSFRGARVITIEGTAIAPDPDTRERAKDRLAAVLADGSSLTELTVQERALARRALVRLSAETKIADATPYTFDWSLQLTAPDPIRYGVAQHTALCGLPQPGVGIEFPIVRWPLDFGTPSGGSMALGNAGTVTTWPIWTITGPCNQPVIRHASSGRSLGFGLSLHDGDVLVVDVAARTVQQGGASRRAALLPGSTWFGLPPGTTGVEFDALRTDTPAVLSAAWRDAWI
ncbi:MAG: phage tail protein [Pseudonocardiaceae bacterium]